MLTLGQHSYASAGVRVVKLRHKIFAGLLLTLSSLNSASWSTTHTVSVLNLNFFTDLQIFHFKPKYHWFLAFRIWSFLSL